MSITQRKINGRTFAVYTEVADHMDALAARLAEADRLLYEALINPQGFSLRAVGEFLGDYQPRVTDSAPAAPTYGGVPFCDLSAADKERVNLGILDEDAKDSASPAPKVCPHYDMVIVNEPGCPDCAAETVDGVKP